MKHYFVINSHAGKGNKVEALAEKYEKMSDQIGMQQQKY